VQAAPFVFAVHEKPSRRNTLLRIQRLADKAEQPDTGSPDTMGYRSCGLRPARRQGRSSLPLESDMKTLAHARILITLATAVTAAASLGACDNMSTRDRDTAIGAGVGGVAGAALGGSALSTVGGAAVGGIIGNQVGK
jgi:osmotically inducible lipoprotein OsmB